GGGLSHPRGLPCHVLFPCRFVKSSGDAASVANPCRRSPTPWAYRCGPSDTSCVVSVSEAMARSPRVIVMTQRRPPTGQTPFGNGLWLCGSNTRVGELV